MRASELVACLERDLILALAEIAKLKLEVALAVGEPIGAHMAPAWADGLTRYETLVMEALLAAHPRYLGLIDLDVVVPPRDHAKDCDSRRFIVFISNIRKKLGSDAIERELGLGYRCSDAFKARTQEHSERKAA